MGESPERNIGATLIKYIMFLRDLKDAAARRKVKLMALVLNKSFATQKMCPSGHARRGLQACSCSALSFFTRFLHAFKYDALITSKPVSQKHHRLNQRYPKMANKRITLLLVLLLPVASFAEDQIELQTTIIKGNKELPKILYIVPWKDIEKSKNAERKLKLHSLFGDLFDPVLPKQDE